jgi:hypothetical protein
VSRRVAGLALVVSALLVVFASSATATATATAAGDGGLVPGRADVPGYHATGAGVALGRAAIAGELPSALRHARTVGAGFRGRGRGITFGVVTASSVGHARAALQALGHGRRP